VQLRSGCSELASTADPRSTTSHLSTHINPTRPSPDTRLDSAVIISHFHNRTVISTMSVSNSSKSSPRAIVHLLELLNSAKAEIRWPEAVLFEREHLTLASETATQALSPSHLTALNNLVASLTTEGREKVTAICLGLDTTAKLGNSMPVPAASQPSGKCHSRA
jgi:hypothetical protein